MTRINLCLFHLCALACLAGLGLTACGEGEEGFGDPGGGAFSPAAGGVSSAGQALYAQLCASCHGQGGGDVRGATGITGVVLNGTRGMPAFPNLSSAEIASIEAYLNGRSDPGGGAAPAGGGAPVASPPPTGRYDEDEEEEEDDD